MQPEIHLGPVTLQTFGIMFALAFIAAGALVARRLNELGQAHRLGLRADPLRPGRRPRRRAPRLHRRELRLRQERPARQHLLRLGAGLVRRRDRRRDRRRPLGVAARDAQRRPPRPLRGPAGARLRDRPDRLPGLRGRRLRQGVGRPLGDGLPARHQADRRRRFTRRRSTRPWRWASSPTCCGACATASRPESCSAIYLVLAGAERFLVEFIRRNDHVLLGLTQAQLISLAMIAGGAAMAGREGIPRQPGPGNRLIPPLRRRRRA